MIKIAPPEGDDMQEVLGVYACIARTFADDMHSLFEQNLRSTLGEDWFIKIKQMRHPHLADTTPSDPTFYIKEPRFNADSPTWNFLPRDDSRFKSNLGRLLVIRNDWAHHDVEANIDNLSRAVVVFEDVAFQLGLPHAENYKRIRERCTQILLGSYVPEPALNAKNKILIETGDQPLSAVEEAFMSSVISEVELGVKEIEKQSRSPIGSVWIGPVGTRKLKIVKLTRDIFDVQTARSVKAELGEQAEQKIVQWLNILKADAEVFVSDDGAIAAPVAGQICLIGYLNEMPDDDGRPQGFLTSDVYEVISGDIFHVRTKSRLSFQANLELDLKKYEGAEVRLTTHGDVALTDPISLERKKIGSLK